MKRLPITLWSCVRTDDREYLSRVVRVLRYCTKLFDFDCVVLFSYLPPAETLPAKTNLVQIPMLDIDQFNIFVNRVAPQFLMRTDAAMSVHEDGFILNPELWDDSFLDFDYIGAQWSDGVVGNGGFNIESRRLMSMKMQLPFYKRLPKLYDGRPFLPSDVYLCREHRATLEAQGIRFAPSEVADRFSVEQRTIAEPAFGYHGRKCQSARYYEGWRKINETEKSLERKP